MMARGYLLSVVLALLAPSLAGAGEFETKHIQVGDSTITVMVYAGQTYRLVTAQHLDDDKLHGQLVCIEGKIKELGQDAVKLFGLEDELKTTGGVLAKRLPGDNVWLGGRIGRTAGKTSFTVTTAVLLKSDLELFEERFAAAAASGDWRGLLDLAEWITRSREYNPKIAFEEHRRYRTCASRAVSKACSAAEEAFGDADADGYVRLSAELARVEADQDLRIQYLKRAAAIDPENGEAAKGLSAAGLVRFRGAWVSPEEKKRLESADRDHQNRRAEAAKALAERRADAAVSGAAGFALDASEMEAAVAGLKGQDLAARLTSEIERAAGPRQVTHALFLASSLTQALQAGPMEAALRSADPLARMAALELAAARGDLQAREWIVKAAGRESSEEVAELACRLLGDAADAQSIEALIGLVEGPKEAGARAAVEALREATGEDRYSKAEWDAWWKRNKAAFPAGPAK